jgi:outer membrane lipoprotein-sorting protein
MRIKQAAAIGLLALTPALTGCLRHTRSVLKTRPPDIVLSTSLDHLLEQVNQRNEAVRSMTATVHIAATTGGSQKGEITQSNKGEVTDISALNGYIVIGRPEQLRVIIELPLGVGQVLNMVSDGKTFKMLIPHESCAITGSDVVTNTAQKGLYKLRPPVILDSLMIQGRQEGQIVAMTQDSRTLPDPKTHKDVIEEPDYDIQFLSQPAGGVAHSLRVIHIGRQTLLPYRQDIYNADGKVETQADYSNYRKFGDITFPTKIVIQRPLDEYTLTITVDKVTFNDPQGLSPDQFDLDIPATYHITNMDDPANGDVKDPCAVHAPQSTH